MNTIRRICRSLAACPSAPVPCSHPHRWSRFLRRSPWFHSLARLMLSSWLDHLLGS